jgi:predicted nucleic acid-binding protein
MSNRFFLDTNLFVYTFDSSSPVKAKKAAELIHRAADTGEGIVSYQVVQEFFNAALRHFPRPMNVAEAEQYLITVFRPLLAIHSSLAVYGSALRVAGKYRLSWYDSLIIAAALEAHCTTLYSEDLNHGQLIEGMRIQNPFR